MQHIIYKGVASHNSEVTGLVFYTQKEIVARLLNREVFLLKFTSSHCTGINDVVTRLDIQEWFQEYGFRTYEPEVKVFVYDLNECRDVPLFPPKEGAANTDKVCQEEADDNNNTHSAHDDKEEQEKKTEKPSPTPAEIAHECAIKKLYDAVQANISYEAGRGRFDTDTQIETCSKMNRIAVANELRKMLIKDGCVCAVEEVGDNEIITLKVSW